MATRREELVTVASRLFADRGYHGTSMADLAEAMGLQKGSLYSLTESKQELLVVITREGPRRSTRRSTGCRTATRSSGSGSRCARISPSSLVR